MSRAPEIPRALAARYPIVICDEHQDCSSAQNRLVLSLHQAGACVRIFGDAMQAIFNKTKSEQRAWQQRWKTLQEAADIVERLETPHRWRKHHAGELGDWIQEARQALGSGEAVDLRGELPEGVFVFRGDNQANPSARNLYQLKRDERRPIDQYVNEDASLLILSPTNATCQTLRAFFGRRVAIWEGHTRYGLSKLVLGCQQSQGDSARLAEALIEFVQGVATGFSDSAYGRVLRREVAESCSSTRRGRPAKIQAIARSIVEYPNHRGIGQALKELIRLINDDETFKGLKVDLWRELRDATRLADYDDPDECLAELALRRSYSRIEIPDRAISTVHKAKGMEREHVLVMPCDQRHFSDTDAKRRLLYVALSRAMKSLALVVPRKSPSPLFRI
jgi:DNA helicase-2/ATP-dependent DNA helicase PcrA